TDAAIINTGQSQDVVYLMMTAETPYTSESSTILPAEKQDDSQLTDKMKTTPILITH
uniref:Uncharacterized protein n=1 Tax=Triticum urartu TaxID=4572 RepID=A0A8R7UIZ0_TRIUA